MNATFYVTRILWSKLFFSPTIECDDDRIYNVERHIRSYIVRNQNYGFIGTEII